MVIRTAEEIVASYHNKPGLPKTVKEFLQVFHKLYPYPSITLLYKRFGGIHNLLCLANKWYEAKENKNATKKN
jgi:hypothetical protein